MAVSLSQAKINKTLLGDYVMILIGVGAVIIKKRKGRTKVFRKRRCRMNNRGKGKMKIKTLNQNAKF